MNRLDDGYPDLLHDGSDYQWPEDYAVKDEDGDGPGLEVKASRGNTFYAHHNVGGWLLGVHYRINVRSESPTEDVPVPEDEEPIEVTQVLCASMDHDDWEYRDAEGSNRTNTSELTAKAGIHEMRKNPVVELAEAITGSEGRLDEYKQNHADSDLQHSS